MDQPRKILVKLKGPLAQQVESILPASLEITGNAARFSNTDWLDKHAIKKMKPLYPEMVREKKARGVTGEQIAQEMRDRFPARAHRAPAGLKAPDLTRTYVIDMSDSAESEVAQKLAELQADPNVEYAEQDMILQANVLPDDPYLTSTTLWTNIFDLYGLYLISCPAAWDTSTGQGIIVGVVDSGVDCTHPDIINNIWNNPGEIPGNGVDDEGDGYIDDVHGWNFVDSNNDVSDLNGHGTHVAGTIAATGNNGIGVIGVAWNARIMPVRGLDSHGNGDIDTLANCVNYAASEGADVINCSWGGPGFSSTLQQTFWLAHYMGAVCVVAAGNANADASVFTPANIPEAITVAASDSNDQLAYFSNWGSKIDVAAPGVNILSLHAAGTTNFPVVGDDYALCSGTSMASPHVAGVAALILSLHPGWTVEQVRQAIRCSADDLGTPGFDYSFGYGRVNAAAAVALANDPLEARITSMLDGMVLTNIGPSTLSGFAEGPNFNHYTLSYGMGQLPTSWTSYYTNSLAVWMGSLSDRGVYLPDGWNTVRLDVYNNAGQIYSDRVTFWINFLSLAYPVPPAPTNDISDGNQFKPGALLPIQGSAAAYQIQWARTNQPWSSAGVTLVGGGINGINGGLLGTWDTTGVTNNEFYGVQLLSQNSGYMTQQVAQVYFQPDLTTANWPKMIPSVSGAFLPRQDAVGTTWLAIPSGGLTLYSWDGASVTNVPLLSPNGIQPAIANLDGNPGDEIVVGESNRVRIIHPDSTSDTITVPSWIRFQSSRIVLTDLDGDGQLEILAPGVGTNYNTYLYAWKPNGQLLSTNYPIVLTSLGSYLAADFNGDGKQEIVVAKSVTNGTLQLIRFNWDGTRSAWADPSFSGGSIQDMAACDMDRDGSIEIAVAYSSTSGPQASVALFSADGTMKPGAWPLTYSCFFGSKLGFGDVNGDGNDELILASGGVGLYVLRADGSQVMSTSCGVVGNFALGDLDGDGAQEIVFEKSSATLAVMRGTGEILRSYPLHATPRVFGSSKPLLGDFNGDGKIDIAVVAACYSSGGTSYSLGTLYTPDFGTGSHTLDWPAFYHDACNTSVKPPHVGSDTAAPTVSITAPTNGAQVSGTITVAANASDNVGVVGVQFLLDGANLGAEDTVSPYSVSWVTTGSSNGSHTLSAVARDAAGNRATNNITVTVNNDTTPPSVTMTAPTNGAQVTGTITVTATASDNISVVGVQFLLDGVNLGAEDTVAPYSVSWATTNSSNGSHALAAIARDAAGNRATNSVTVTVMNDRTPPTVSISSPTNNARIGGVFTISATATDNVAVAGVQFRLDGANLGAEDTSSPYSIAWNTTTNLVGSHSISAVARDVNGNSSTSSVVTVTVTNMIKINFQPATAPTYTGYWVDSGAVYGARTNGYSYGWNANNSTNAFDRNSTLSADQRYDTLITMQTGGTFTWEIGLPNRNYKVHVVAGDANYYNSVYKINVEGVLTVNGTPSSGSRWKEGTSTVTVSDGKLTVSNATGASNNKICFLEITPQ
ncbi:MAG: S8 family serine peptidase [Verrucomicrobiota bacterium]